MFLMYVDESGDIGLSANSPTQYFVLTGLVVHELRWKDYLQQLIAFRRDMRNKYGLKLREEIHAQAMLSRNSGYSHIRKHERLAILREFADTLAQMPDLNFINIVVDKSTKQAGYDVFETAWKALIQRMENTMSYKNFRGPYNSDERGILLPDNTDNKKLQDLLRRMRYFNPIPHSTNFTNNTGIDGYRNLLIGNVIEDPLFKDSQHSYFIQACDLCAYLLYQEIAPNSYIRKKGGHHYFNRLDNVLCKVASISDPRGIVRL